jgi:pimeloyl-ACP methyl ester carboxylesterase
LGILGVIVGAYVLAMLLAFIYARIREKFSYRRQSRQPQDINDTGTPEVVVTLVHGTWAQNAAWTQSDSELCRHLKQKFGDNILFHSHRWSGGNSFRARRAASRALAPQLEEMLVRFPDARHFVVGHSHGGNVALAALTPEIGRRLDGLICLATPVLVSRPRLFDPLTRKLFPWMSAAPVLVMAVLAELRLVSDSLLPAGPLLGILILSGYLLRKPILNRFETATSDPDFSALSSHKAVFIRAVGDEASSAIGTLHLVSWLVATALRIPIGIVGEARGQLDTFRAHLLKRKGLLALGVFGLPLAGFVAAIIVAGIGQSISSPQDNPLDPAALAVALVPIAISVMLISILVRGTWLMSLYIYVWLSVLLLPMTLVIALAGFAIGPEMAIAALVREVTVEATPPGAWRVELVAKQTLAADGDPAARLQHSTVYTSPEALHEIAEWMEERVRLLPA